MGNQLQKFAHRLYRRTGGKFFIDIIYNPGRLSRSIRLAQMCVARPRLQVLHRGGAVENAHFAFVHQKDARDEIGDAFGKGSTPDIAFRDLLDCIAGKKLQVRLGRRTLRVIVPADIAR